MDNNVKIGHLFTQKAITDLTCPLSTDIHILVRVPNFLEFKALPTPKNY